MARNNPSENEATWRDFERNGSDGDFQTLVQMSNCNSAKAFAMFGSEPIDIGNNLTLSRRMFQNGSEVELSQALHEDLILQYKHIVHCDGYFWHYFKNAWQKINTDDIRKIAHSYDGSLKGQNGTIKLGKNTIDGALHELAVCCRDNDFFKTRTVGINCLSGLITFNAAGNPELFPHSPDHHQRFCVQAQCNQTPIYSGSLLERLLEGCFKNDTEKNAKISLVGEMLGVACLGFSTKLKAPKAFILKGETAANGKSQILKLFQGLMPKHSVSSISPKDFEKDHYKEILSGKALNVCDELPAKAIASDRFKQIITGDTITGCAKYKSPISFQPEALHIFATNILPSFQSGMDRGVIRRLCIIPFNRSIPHEERIENIAEKILNDEMDLLLAFAVSGAQRILQNSQYTEISEAESALLEWIYNADPVLAWFESSCVLCESSRYAKNQAYKDFSFWAANQGYKNLPAINNFTQRIKGIDKRISESRIGSCRFFVGFSGS